MNVVDRLVEAVRRHSEAILPWFDPERSASEKVREQAVLHEAQEAQRLGRDALGAYRRAHQLRRP